MSDFNITSFGGVGDGAFDNSKAFASAMLAIKKAGGGILHVEKGFWRTGPIELYSGTTLFLEEGCVVSFIPEPERYTPVWSRWEGVECYAMHPCVFAAAQKDISIMGKGTLDGSGETWWKIAQEKKRRPQTSPELPIEFELAYLNPNYNDQPSAGRCRPPRAYAPANLRNRRGASF